MAPSIKSQLKPKIYNFNQEEKSKGILDDFAIRKDIATRSGVIEHTPTLDKHIVNKEYCDSNIIPIKKAWDFNLNNLNALYTNDTKHFMIVALENITITRVKVKLDVATNQIAGDLKHCSNFIGLTDATVIQAFDTTSGASDNTGLSVNVNKDKEIYIQFDSEPHADITQAQFHIEWEYQ